jgi:hypothetical protein
MSEACVVFREEQSLPPVPGLQYTQVKLIFQGQRESGGEGVVVPVTFSAELSHWNIGKRLDIL